VLVLRFEARTAERRDAIRAEVEAVVARPPKPASSVRRSAVGVTTRPREEPWTIRRVLAWAADDLKKRGNPLAAPRRGAAARQGAEGARA
jgi:hypothetical protein